MNKEKFYTGFWYLVCQICTVLLSIRGFIEILKDFNDNNVPIITVPLFAILIIFNIIIAHFVVSKIIED